MANKDFLSFFNITRLQECLKTQLPDLKHVGGKFYVLNLCFIILWLVILYNSFITLILKHKAKSCFYVKQQKQGWIGFTLFKLAVTDKDSKYFFTRPVSVGFGLGLKKKQ